MKINVDLVEKQKKELIEDIISGQNHSYISVCNLEAGVGKTRTAEQGIAQGVKQGQRYIFVRQRDDDCAESAEAINKLCGKKVALPYNNKIYTTQGERLNAQKQFHRYPVLAITHSKYLSLIQDTKQRKIFAAGRSGLIIDEFIDTVSRLQLSMVDGRFKHY